MSEKQSGYEVAEAMEVLSKNIRSLKYDLKQNHRTIERLSDERDALKRVNTRYRSLLKEIEAAFDTEETDAQKLGAIRKVLELVDGKLYKVQFVDHIGMWEVYDPETHQRWAYHSEAQAREAAHQKGIGASE